MSLVFLICLTVSQWRKHGEVDTVERDPGLLIFIIEIFLANSDTEFLECLHRQITLLLRFLSTRQILVRFGMNVVFQIIDEYAHVLDRVRLYLMYRLKRV